MLNTVILMGRLTDKPELRKTNTDISLTSFTLAVDGVKKDAVNWIDCTAWRQTAEFITKYFDKGQMIAVTGHIASETYTGKDGTRKKAITVQVDNASFCGGKGGSTEPTATKDDDFEEVGTSADLPF